MDAQRVVYTDPEATAGSEGGPRPLAPPFAAIFGDRATAEWAFGLLAETVRRLGGWPDDPRFALTLPHGRTMLRLNLGNWMVMGISARAGVMHLTALVEPMEQAYSFERRAPFARSDDAMAVFAIPLETAREWPDELRRIYEESLLALAERFGSYGASPYRRAHQAGLFRALFDEVERERLLTHGLPAVDEKGERAAPGPAGPRARAVREAAPQWTAGQPVPQAYDRADFLRETYLNEETADELRDLLLERKQLLLYGPPGTGKTFVARRLGRWLTGLADPPPERLTVIQFHPAYSYEEFIEGIRPESRERGGRHHVDYPPRPGVFVRFCRQAAGVDGPCVFIIDEINRGNIPRIFGELLLLLEYRDEAVPLPYSGERFRIPPNVYLIGTMNTADRSIALVDFALRRRFHFFRFAADPDLFGRWLARHPSSLPYLGGLYRRLATEAVDDPDYAIGPSYFMRDLDEAGLARLWRRSIMPYLEEYYIDQPARAQLWAWDGELVRDLREQRDGG
jgi:5-methylcytosine-specific restriction protein B